MAPFSSSSPASGETLPGDTKGSLQQQLDRLIGENQGLSQMGKQQREFIFAAIRDLSSPLTSVMGFNQVLMQEFLSGQSPQVTLQLMQTIQAFSEQQLELINTLLEFALAGRTTASEIADNTK